MPANSLPLAQQVDQLLPQTQCTQCEYPRCRAYADAIASGDAEINQCPPGGSVTIAALSALTGKPAKPLNPQHGVEEPRLLAWINEAACIGCKLCIKVCPVDAIIGAGKVMHTVIVNECTGCKLCVPVCPTDCIDLIPTTHLHSDHSASPWPEFSHDQVDKARRRAEQHFAREAKRDADRRQQRIEKHRQQLQREIAAVLTRKRGAK